jgi:hypothetical protein
MCGLGSSPKIPPPPPPIPPPQAEKAPEQETFKRKNVAGSRGAMGAGNASTILTGSGGDVVPQGQLGSNTLLGG